MNKLIALLCLLFLTNVVFSQSSVSEQEMKMKMLMNKNKLLAITREQSSRVSEEETASRQKEEKEERNRRSRAYSEAYDKAWEGYKPLVIWVNLVNLESESKFPNAVHLHVQSYKEVEGRGIVVGLRINGKFARYDFANESDLESFLLQLQSSFRALPNINTQQINLQPLNLQQINPLPSTIFSDIITNARPQSFSNPWPSAPSPSFMPSFAPQSSGSGFSSRRSANC